MRKVVPVFLVLVLGITVAGFAQQRGPKIKVIGGMRVNPMVVVDSHGNKKEFTRLHTELGVLLQKKVYLSAGYTPYTNAFYTFNEYWFRGFDKKLPVSIVGILEYNADTDRTYANLGFNLKLSAVGNGIVMIGSEVGRWERVVKVGAFIPLSFVIYQK